MKPLRVTIQMKPFEKRLPLMLLIMLCKVALSLESVDKILRVTIQMKVAEQCSDSAYHKHAIQSYSIKHLSMLIEP